MSPNPFMTSAVRTCLLRSMLDISESVDAVLLLLVVYGFLLLSIKINQIKATKVMIPLNFAEDFLL